MAIDTLLLLLLLAAVVILIMRQMRAKGGTGDAEALAELRGQLATLATQSGALQQTVASAMQESEGRLGTRLEQSLRDQNERTNRSLTGMAEKLAVIEKANEHISALSGQVTDLQNILSNKQARGSFGEVQLENLVRDALPDSAYSFQHTLGNGRRVDCFIEMPSPPGSICIDSKFPLESSRALAAAADEPSEAVHAEINLQLPKLVEESRRKRVYMAGPDNLMLLLHTVRAILRDARMHEAAGKIQAEVDTMMQDVGRLDERVRKLASHFGQVEKDIDDIQTSTRKITSRGNRITQIDVGEEEAPRPGLPVEPD